ncbi:MAG: hypothetical protein QNJ47_12035 [Nostocaceae cyanobacterium]|nr:hypothetical protein [Nostocaceae cyanobacterium]
MQNLISEQIQTKDNIKPNFKFNAKGQQKSEKKQQHLQELRPLLTCKINYYPHQFILSQDGRNFVFEVNRLSGEMFKNLLKMMDGTKTINEIQQIVSPQNPEIVHNFVHQLDQCNLLDDVSQVRVNSGRDILLELEALTNGLLENDLFKFKNLKQIDESQINIVYGYAIEYYHLFARKYDFYSPVLGFQDSTKIRKLINKLYYQEYGQDKLVLESLISLGISSEDLIETMPLPETMAMCNGLLFWSSFEPLFFFSTLEILTSQTINNLQFYIQGCEKLEIESRFVNPIRQLLKNLQNIQAENFTHYIFEEIPHIDGETKQRLREQSYLFIEMYSNFHKAIWNYYSSTSNLLRQVLAI